MWARDLAWQRRYRQAGRIDLDPYLAAVVDGRPN
jgi:hypothetical protein